MKEDGLGFGEDDGDDMGDEFEGNADVADMNIKKDNGSEADDIDEELDFGAG